MKYHGSKVAWMGLLFALSLVLSFVESVFSGWIPIPGIKLGLSNIVVMYCLFFLGKKEAYELAGLKAFFVFLTRGPVGAAMSLCGGLVSVTVMLCLIRIGCSPLFISICGGLSHNIGQLFAASLLLKSNAVFYYFPVLAVAGMGMGVFTGTTMRLLRPYLQKISQSCIEEAKRE
ncbi:MAG: Gx transporter family protein [Oscillospiraceae bacterium]|nr:Gx transporter family protein [Oscillospiraceae bacterium]RKJ58664.1 Gx transporter family protein [bacterium 1XD42-8]RKJ67609.1 Gx transporter family protein [bacterium 1XD42-1]